MEKHKERKRACVPLQGAVSIETSYISFDDCFAALQIDLCVRGWIEGVWRNLRLHHSHQFPSYVRSIREISHSLTKNAVYYTLSPPQKQAARKLSFRAPDIQNLQHRIATYTQNHIILIHEHTLLSVHSHASSFFPAQADPLYHVSLSPKNNPSSSESVSALSHPFQPKDQVLHAVSSRAAF